MLDQFLNQNDWYYNRQKFVFACFRNMGREKKCNVFDMNTPDKKPSRFSIKSAL